MQPWMWDYLAGLLTWPLAIVLSHVLRALWWTGRDAWVLLADAELRPGMSKWNWLWILPRFAFNVFFKELWRGANGERRVS